MLTVIEVFDVSEEKNTRERNNKAERFFSMPVGPLTDGDSVATQDVEPNKMSSKCRDKEEYDRLVRELDNILDCREEFPSRESNWGRAWQILQKLDGIVRRMPLTKAERKRLNDEIQHLNGNFGRAVEIAVEEYPIKMESVLETLRSTIDKVKNRELPARRAWAAIREANSFFQNNRIRSATRDEGILRFKAMVQELKTFQRKK